MTSCVKNDCESCLELSSAKGEVDVDGGFHLGRIPIQKVWLVTPALHSIQRAAGLHRWSADDLQVLDRARLGDNRMQDDHTLNVGGFGDRRVDRLRLRKRHAGNRSAG